MEYRKETPKPDPPEQLPDCDTVIVLSRKPVADPRDSDGVRASQDEFEQGDEVPIDIARELWAESDVYRFNRLLPIDSDGEPLAPPGGWPDIELGALVHSPQSRTVRDLRDALEAWHDDDADRLEALEEQLEDLKSDQ